MIKTQKFLKFFFDGVVLSYSQIFFSNKRWFGLLMILFTIINPIKTLIGIASIVIALAMGLMFNFDKNLLKSGLYTYNGLLVGIGIASLYEFSPKVLIVIVFYSILCLFLSVWLHHLFQKRNLPFLTIPFLLCIWMIHISNTSYGKIIHNTEIELIFDWIKPLSNLFSHFIDTFYYKDFIHIFLKSISAIFFIYNDLIGALMLFALLLYSRISFTLAVFGFTIGALYFWLVVGDYRGLVIDHVGFNFILVAIALGGFFIVPSFKSYLLQFFSVALSCVLLGAISPIFWSLKSPVYSFPFVMVVLIVISALKLRVVSNGIEIVTNQQFQPEKNVYKNFYEKLRFKANTYYRVYLPIIGEWNISQGIDGGITHLEHWKYAWDFDIQNFQNKTYKQNGTELKDFLCYDLPVIAPVSGYVVTISDDIEDNDIGKVNTTFNWGNTIVIKVDEHFYVQLSHLKPKSFQANLGDYVHAGQIIGSCGNSGRSPEPHLHFQIQITPDIGSKTIQYPIAYYLTKNTDHYLDFHAFDYPKENEKVLNVIPNLGMQKAFTFFPNHTIEWDVETKNKNYSIKWIIKTDGFNKSYFYDGQSNSYAYFKNDGILFYFYDFVGDKESELFLFYLALQKIILAPNLYCKIKDWIMPTYILSFEKIWIQDFIAPFYQLFKGKYESEIVAIDQTHYPSEIEIESSVTSSFFNSTKDFLHCKTRLSNQKLSTLEITKNKTKTNLKCISILPLY